MSRRVSVSGSMHVLDNDFSDGNESQSFPFHSTVFLGADGARELVRRQGCVDEEVRVELQLDAQLDGGKGVRIAGRFKLFEDAAASADDGGGDTTIAFFVPHGRSRNVHLRLQDTDDGGDYADLIMTVSNRAT